MLLDDRECKPESEDETAAQNSVLTPIHLTHSQERNSNQQAMMCGIVSDDYSNERIPSTEREDCPPINRYECNNGKYLSNVNSTVLVCMANSLVQRQQREKRVISH